MSDPIQHLRELMAKACPMYAKASTYHNDGKLAARVFHANVTGHELLKITGEPGNVRLLVDLIPHIPALLAVAESARHHEIVRERMSSWDEYEASRKVLQDAIAKLDEVKHG